MRSAFTQTCTELARSLTPALVELGYAAPADPFSRDVLRYAFKRLSPQGTQSFDVLFDKYRRPMFQVQLFIEPATGLADLEEHGGWLIIGHLSASPPYWPLGVQPFRGAPTRLQRLLRLPKPTPESAVRAALKLMPEVERWWNTQRSSRHILTSRLVYRGMRSARQTS